MENKEYCVYCHTCPNGMQYFGISKNVKSRWRPSLYKNCTLFYEAIIEFGWKSIQHIVLYSGLTQCNALEIEGLLITKARENGTCLNVHRSGNYQQTDEFKEENSAYQKAYRETHPEECKARCKAWREAHQEEEKARKKARREAHPEKEKARLKAWREAHREECNAHQREYRKRKKEENNDNEKDINNNNHSTNPRKLF